MYKIFLYSILIIFTFFLNGSAFSQDAALSKVITGNGLHTTDFNIPEGILTVYLPSDMTVAENASGTFNLKEINAQGSLNQVLTKYNFVVESQVIATNGNKFSIQVPVNLPTGVLSISLQDKQGKILNRAFFPVRLTKRSQLPVNAGGTGNFRTPATSRAGMPAMVNGPFDGDFQNSFISISGQPVILLSESTRQLVFLIPDGVQGLKVLSLREGATDFKTPFTILHVVKVGRDNPSLISRKDGTTATNPKGNSQGVLIESDKQFGKIDLEYDPDLGKTSQDINSPIPSKRKITATEQPTLGPSIDDVSKPLELDPKELQKYSQPMQAKNSSENEFTSLKQFSDKPAAKPEIKNKPVPDPALAATPVINPGNSGYADIKEVKPLLDKQISSPFTPLETADKSKTVDKTTAKKTEQIKKEPEKPKTPIKPVVAKKEVKPVTPVKKIAAKPPVPKVSVAKPVVKTDINKDSSAGNVKASKPVQKSTPPSKATPKDVKAKPAQNASDYSSKMDDKAVKSKKVSSKTEPKVVKENSKQQELSKTKTKPLPHSNQDKEKYKKINDLSSLNAKNGSYQSTNKKELNSVNNKLQEKTEEQIKEKEFVSLNKKETNKPEIKTSPVKGKFAIQLASFKKKSEASHLVGKLNAGGYDVYYKRFKVPGKGYWYRVRKGGFSSRNEAEAYKASLNLTKYHINSFFVTAEN